jgi:hypothetical protein
VAAAAVRTKSPIVFIIVPVAIRTHRADGLLSLERLSMAAFASHHFVRAFQSEDSLRVVVELPEFPVDRVVAVVAGIRKTVFMRIVFRMAGDTLGVRVLKNVRIMTILALGLLVFAEQREVR